MSTLQGHEAIQTTDTSRTLRRPWQRILLLSSLFVLLILAAPESADRLAPLLHFWMVSFLPCFAASASVLATKPHLALRVLLGRKGLDQSRVMLYAWCPLPVIECAMQ